jgi:hydroxymethylglutaryl-CoA lyase
VNETPSGETERVRVTEVGPRDGLQNQTEIIGVEDKVRLVDLLSRTGVDEIEVSSFVSKRWVPQLGDAPDVFRQIDRQPGVVYSALVPNLEGLAGAIEAEVPKVAVFTAASETFCRKNINCSISQSLEKIDQVIAEAKFENLKVRGYISCVIECPFEGPIDPTAVVDVASQLRDMGR